MKNLNQVAAVFAILFLHSCASKKDILYLQDVSHVDGNEINYKFSKILPNDILDISVRALVAETTLPYNRQMSANLIGTSLDVLKLEGYLVSKEGTIVFPVLGKINVGGKTTGEVELIIQNLLENGGHLKEPTVSVRLLNGKVTILGEVKSPGTYAFTEQNITLPQALGYAGDLTINGQRNDVLLITEENGRRKVVHIDLTSSTWVDTPYFFVKPNDFIVVNPNDSKVRSAGFIGDAGTILTIASIVLSTVILLTKI
jgi:polysaccharide export outer membrane protein